MRSAVRTEAGAAPRVPSRGREHELEPEHGLPEALPADERLLWQGQPTTARVATRIFHLPVLAAYFALMLGWRIAVQLQDGGAWHEALRGTLGLALLAAVALGIVATLARLTARTTVYTLTDKRVVMRIGIVLTVTYNLPLRQIDAAHLLPLKDGGGEIALALRGDTRIAMLHLWPHARPWHFTRTQPMLRCLPDAQAVAARLTQAWATANETAARPAAAPAATSAGSAGQSAGHAGPQPVSA
ncbi:MAG: photosynthetic complex putative assembly protein PuhB [Rubrivivax sp.]